LIRKLREFQIGQVIRAEGPQTSSQSLADGRAADSDRGAGATLLWADLTNLRVDRGADGGRLRRDQVADDYLKIVRRSHHGLLPRRWGSRSSSGSRSASCCSSSSTERLQHPPGVSVLQADHRISAGGISLRGLRLVSESTPSTSPTASTASRSASSRLPPRLYRAGHRHRPPRLRQYLLLVRFPQATELTVFCGALVGASLSFLWYSCPEIFMGDVGSLALGALGIVAILIKRSCCCRSSAASSAGRAAGQYFKATGGRRLFRIKRHHRFELIGWSGRR
jgi:phospho-N-acetylmuramoyl-pentapeptide-transferase